MTLPNHILTGLELDSFLESSQNYSLTSIKDHFAKYEPTSLKKNWFSLLRCIDELINLPWEIEDDNLRNEFLALSFNLLDKVELKKFMFVLEGIESQFGKEVSTRLFQFAQMNFASTMAYESKGLNKLLPFNFSAVNSAILYYQSRRKYYVTILDLIDEWAKGDYSFEFIDMLNQVQYTIDSCLQTITANYFSILLNNSLSDYSIDFQKSPPLPSHQFKNLEAFLLEPQVLTMADQLEFRFDQTLSVDVTPKPKDKVFSYSEVENNIKLITSIFNKYNVRKNTLFIELSFLVYKLKDYCFDDYYIKVPNAIFNLEIQPFIKTINMFGIKSDYFYASNFISTFQKTNGNLICTVVLLNRFITHTIHRHLSKNKSFQINSGFVFEDKVASILEQHAYELTGITRINKKEFDVITIKDNHIYNFQCKNNNIDISKIQDEPKRMARLNKRLINYYNRAFIKETLREDLIKQKLNVNDITHFIVSRYPVVTDIEYIINFNELEQRIKVPNKT